MRQGGNNPPQPRSSALFDRKLIHPWPTSSNIPHLKLKYWMAPALDQKKVTLFRIRGRTPYQSRSFSLSTSTSDQDYILPVLSMTRCSHEPCSIGHCRYNGTSVEADHRGFHHKREEPDVLTSHCARSAKNIVIWYGVNARRKQIEKEYI